jgi:hypothetical protein
MHVFPDVSSIRQTSQRILTVLFSIKCHYRKYATMDVKTYILYDKLLDQQSELTAAVTELEVGRTFCFQNRPYFILLLTSKISQQTSQMYQEQARRLKATWLHRKQMYEVSNDQQKRGGNVSL